MPVQVLDTLRGANDGAALKQVGARAGLGTAETEAIIENVLPEFSRHVERNTLSRGGISDFMNLLDSTDFQDFLAKPDLAGDAAARNFGKAVLGQIVGTKHGSRSIAARASRATGIDAATIEKMLPELATLSLGGLQQQTASQFGDIFSQLPTGGQSSSGNVGQQSPLPMPGGAANGGGWGQDWQPGQQIPQGSPWPQQSGGSSTTTGNDGSFGNQSPLPVPGGAPGGDWGTGGSSGSGRGQGGERNGGGFRDLSDILRRRGGRLPNQKGGSLPKTIRDILGSAFGFKNSGVMSWIIRFVLIRVAWPILRRMIFGR